MGNVKYGVITFATQFLLLAMASGQHHVNCFRSDDILRSASIWAQTYWATRDPSNLDSVILNI